MAVNVERTMENYRHAGNLKSRVSIYDHRQDPFDPVDFAAGLLPGDLGLVLDAGAGYGRYTKRIRADHPAATVVAIDKGPGMLSEVPEPVMVADAQAIPYPDSCADAVLAMHMLYHVPDIAKAVAEFRRVLKPGGTLLVSTNSHEDMAALYGLWAKSADAVPGVGGYDPGETIASFNSANAPAYLQAEFESVEVFEHSGLVAVPETAPIIDYFRSARSFFNCDDALYEESMTVAEGLLAAHFAEHKTFDFVKTPVFYRCR